MLYVGIFMIVAVAAFLAIDQMVRSEVPLRQNTVAKETGEGFSGAIWLAVKGGEGFTYVYPFQRTLYGQGYVITLRPSGPDLFIDWAGPYGDFGYAYSLPAYDYEIVDSPPCIEGGAIDSVSCQGSLLLENQGGKLVISEKV